MNRLAGFTESLLSLSQGARMGLDSSWTQNEGKLYYDKSAHLHSICRQEFTA